MIFVAIVTQGAPTGSEAPARNQTLLVDGSVSIFDLVNVAAELYSPVLMIEVSKPLSHERLRAKEEKAGDGIHL